MVGNLYAFRATDQGDLMKTHAPVGEFPCRECPGEPAHNRNDCELRKLAAEASLIVVAWGANPGPIAHRADYVSLLLRENHRAIYCLGRNANGSPRHPSRLANDTELEEWA